MTPLRPGATAHGVRWAKTWDGWHAWVGTFEARIDGPWPPDDTWTAWVAALDLSWTDYTPGLASWADAENRVMQALADRTRPAEPTLPL